MNFNVSICVKGNINSFSFWIFNCFCFQNSCLKKFLFDLLQYVAICSLVLIKLNLFILHKSYSLCCVRHESNSFISYFISNIVMIIHYPCFIFVCSFIYIHLFLNFCYLLFVSYCVCGILSLIFDEHHSSCTCNANGWKCFFLRNKTKRKTEEIHFITTN